MIGTHHNFTKVWSQYINRINIYWLITFANTWCQKFSPAIGQREVIQEKNDGISIAWYCIWNKPEIVLNSLHENTSNYIFLTCVNILHENIHSKKSCHHCFRSWNPFSSIYRCASKIRQQKKMSANLVAQILMLTTYTSLHNTIWFCWKSKVYEL